MRQRTFAAAATATLVVTAALTVPAQGAHPRVVQRTLVATNEPDNTNFVDNPPVEGKPGAGDVLAFTADLTEHNRPAGIAEVTAVGVDDRRHGLELQATLLLHGGRLQLAGLSTGQGTDSLAITGGTGRYARARGSATLTDHGRRSTIRLRLAS